jgi:hypothetical protein
LFVVVDANGLMSFFFGASESGQEHACEDGYDGDDDEEFDQCECARSSIMRRLRNDFVHREHPGGTPMDWSSQAKFAAAN